MKKMILLIALLFIAAAYAEEYEYMCWSKGQKMDFTACNPDIPVKTCQTDPACRSCVKIKDSGKVCPSVDNYCHSADCINAVDEPLDITPPVLMVYSPANNTLYNSRYITVNISLDYPAALYLGENILCRSCRTYAQRKTFSQGQNNITITARDPASNEATVDIGFAVDSIKPRIKSTYPTQGYSSGALTILFTEKNPSELMLYYGNASEVKEKEVDLSGCIRKRYTNCTVTANVSGNFQYYFGLSDIAGNKAVSRKYRLIADTTPPKILSPIKINSRYSQYYRLNVSIDEDNFDEADYKDNGGRWHSLCSRLAKGSCIATKRFAFGENNITIKAMDKAGNSQQKSFNFMST